MSGSNNEIEWISVCKFGAMGDGLTMNTSFIQQAIQAAVDQGGGIVIFPPGTYLTGTIFLKSNVTLHLSANATLLGSTDIEDYYNCRILHFPIEFSRSLIYAEQAQNIAITGRGTIDGQGKSFPYGAENFNVEDMDKAEVQESFSRPVMVRFEKCKKITIRDIHLQKGAGMAMHYEGCSDIRITGIDVENRSNQNTDGLDFIDCENVFINSCKLSCGDDAIPIFGSARNFIISDCIISSRWAGFRFGPFSTGHFRDIVVSNCIIHHTYGSAIKFQMVEGGIMENISFNNIVMDHVTGPISIRLGGWLGWRLERKESLPTGILRNVRFSNIRASIADNSYPLDHEGPRMPGELHSCINICGLPGHPVQGVSLHNIHLTFPGGGTEEDAVRRDIPEYPDSYPEYHMFGTLPSYALYTRHVDGLELSNVRLELDGDDVRPAMVFDDAHNVEILSLDIAEAYKTDTVIRLRHSSHMFVTGCRILQESLSFIKIEDEECSEITITNNMLQKTEKLLETAVGEHEDKLIGLMGMGNVTSSQF